MLPSENDTIEIETQASPYYGERTIKLYIFYPNKELKNVNENTGVFLSLHNWGGKKATGAPKPNVLSERYNTIAICVDYLQSGIGSPPDDEHPYDLGYLQTIDVLRALYHVISELEKQKININKKRIYATGGSGGGGLSLMANKFAPRTFALIFDIVGVSGLTDDVAYGMDERCRLNAGYSRDKNHPNYLTVDQRDIRDIGFLEHLKVMKSFNQEAKIISCHGVNDSSCLVEHKKRIVENMQQVGLDIEAHFFTDEDIDGEVITNSEHGLGDRTKILMRYADSYLLEESPQLKLNQQMNDFDRADQVNYKTQNGNFVIDYSKGYPSISMIEN